MAFHVACPITCRRICYCSLGFRKKKGAEDEETLNEKLNLFLGLVKGDDDKSTVQVLVPKVAVVVRDEVSLRDVPVVDGDVAKRAALQKEAAAASIVAEDFARRFESGEAVGLTQDVAGEEQVLSNGKVMCRLCFSGEYERTERARRMLSCKSCNKKYHRSCLKAWSHDRDLFHWSSWTCPSCRVCEVCQKTGDPNKLMFCKRCDGAYHCYCQHPPHKNVSRGPYLCPKHTRCHSCSSTVPGNGSSLRWFLGYTCCDACGRLFVKGNYCPVCLKVYRDSESTPMVCCDICQRWVHCHCDGISDEKYMQFQVDNHLKYSCATCRGECYQVRDLEDAVQELWRRRDKADQTLIIRLRAAAGLPIQDEIFNISPYSDSEDDGPPLKKEYGHSLKFSLKGIVDQSPKKNKDYTKKSSNNKYGKEKGFLAPGFGRIEYSDAQSVGSLTGDNKDEDVQSRRNGEPETARLIDGVWPVDRTEAVKTKPVNEVLVKTDSRVLRDKQKKHRSHQLGAVDVTGKEAVKSSNTKGPKLVIHLGARNKNVANSPRSDASNSLPEQVWTTPNGDNTDQADVIGRNLRERGGNLIKMKKPNLEHSDVNSAGGGTEKTRITFGKRSMRRSALTPGAAHEKALGDLNDNNTGPPLVSHSSQKEPKPPLRLKFKNLYSDDQSSWASPGEEDKSLVKGQRSKRKRPQPTMDNSSSMGEIMDANWIIQKLGKHAIGKIVEVHQPSNNSWLFGENVFWVNWAHHLDPFSYLPTLHFPPLLSGDNPASSVNAKNCHLPKSFSCRHKGTVLEVFEDASTVSVTLDDGNALNVDLGKQGIRFVQKKQRH
ncbi:zinc finger, FYVE/PHD-type containing protein [Tanacetum coccineum]|uniref:Zinc finger, FYVE/PHD-type containing protein n=1 Tax=Tanacetum coccineum TaxID=301880 RepID=A0ABQ5A4B9_9ASTR